MFSTNDTIVAIATPPGRGGIGVVRLSGPDAHAITLRLVTHNGSLRPRRATLTRIACTTDAAAEPIDQVVVTSFPRPHSYTGDDVVEVSAHGSPVILRAIVEAAIDRGARLAEPGEFTLRAFLNGRIDLMQAEAVADLIDAVTPLQARAAFDQLEGTLTAAIAGIDAALFDLVARLEASVDFPDEGYHFVEPGALGRAIDDLAGRTAALLAGAGLDVLRRAIIAALDVEPVRDRPALTNVRHIELVERAHVALTRAAGAARRSMPEEFVLADLQDARAALEEISGRRASEALLEHIFARFCIGK